jgi:adenine-specific DNA-methyltransferase
MTAVLKQHDGSRRLSMVDSERKRIGRDTAREKKSALGQFMTPAEIATFMASLLPTATGEVRLLDAGAGIGSLTSAVLDRQLHGDFNATSLHATAFEIDPALIPPLTETLEHYRAEDGRITFDVIPRDFLGEGMTGLNTGDLAPFTHAILNPPYKKISSQSEHRENLRKAGIETVNLYSGFVGLALLLMAPEGTLCAIIPRSFCNGPYYRPFRELILRHAAIKRVHLFGSRTQAFSDDDVLQENVIIVLERGGLQGDVTLSSSRDGTFADMETWSLPIASVVGADDAERVICLPTKDEALGVIPSKFTATLKDLGVQVSTGPIVDFRMREHLRAQPESGAVPLLYPVHFVDGELCWPREGIKKSNAIAFNNATARWLFPRGNYAIVRRFSSKEEKRRVVSNLIKDVDLKHDHIGLENHINVFHSAKRGLSRELAAGLNVYLNSTVVDVHFRTFNGHTQVNATDLKMLPYPDLATLLKMGEWAEQQNRLSQEAIDRCVEEMS